MSPPFQLLPGLWRGVAFLAIVGAIIAPLRAETPRPLRIAYVHSFACVPLGIAEDQGYWREADLKVELRGYQTSVEVVSALRRGEVDIAYDRLGTWLDVALAGDPIAIAGETDWSNGTDKLLVRQGTPIASLRGKAIAVGLRGSAQLLFLRESLAREGASLPDFLLVEVPEQEKALQLFNEGKLHAVVCDEPWASRIAAAGARTVATTADFPGVAPEGFAFRTGAVDDAVLQRFFAAWFRAVNFLHDPAHAAAVAETASIYSFAGDEAVTPADVAMYARANPVHDPAAALRTNDVENGNTRHLIQQMRVLLRLQGRQVTEPELARYFHLQPIRAAAGTLATVAVK